MVVLRLGHGCPQLSGLQELGHQDAQAVLVRELRREDLEDGLAGARAAAWATVSLGDTVRVQRAGWTRALGPQLG